VVQLTYAAKYTFDNWPKYTTNHQSGFDVIFHSGDYKRTVKLNFSHYINLINWLPEECVVLQCKTPKAFGQRFA